MEQGDSAARSAFKNYIKINTQTAEMPFFFVYFSANKITSLFRFCIGRYCKMMKYAV